MQSAKTVGANAHINTESKRQRDDVVAFLSHKQDEFSDRCSAMGKEILLRSSCKVWFDLSQEMLTSETMKDGVRSSNCFVLCASQGYVASWFCQMEVITALSLNKPILILFDERKTNGWSIVLEKLDQFVSDLYTVIKAHEEWKKLSLNLSLSDVKERLLAHPQPFYLKRNSIERDQMLRSIVDLGNGPSVTFTKTTVNKDFTNANMFLVGHSQFGAEQCELIALGLESQGAKAMVLDDVEEVERAFSLNKAGLVVFLTDQVFTQFHVARAVELANQNNQKVLGVFEAYFRKDKATLEGGTWNPSVLRAQTNNQILLALIDTYCLQFSQWDRKGEMFQHHMTTIGAKMGFTPLFANINLLPTFTWAQGKARELEDGTREWLFEKAKEICANKPSCVFVSNAGMGKSCVMGALAKRHFPSLARMSGDLASTDEMNIGAIHFFRYADEVEKKISTGVQSLAKQLCVTLPGYRTCLPTVDIIQKVIEDSNVMQPERVALHLFRELIVKPCRSMTNTPPNKVIVLIDALDECENSDAITSAMKELWATSAEEVKPEQAPPWLVLMVSTRPQSIAKERFKSFDQVKLEPTDEQNEQDLRLFVTKRMERWHVEPESKGGLVKAVLDQSEGVFLWLSFQETDLKKLAETLSLNVESIQALPKGLDEVYVKFFSRIKTEMSKLNLGEDLYDRTLAYGLVAPRRPIPEVLWKECLSFGDSKAERETYKRLRGELSKLLIFDSSTGEVHAPHKTMVDFLQALDPKHEADVVTVNVDDSDASGLRVEVTSQHHSALGLMMCSYLDKIVKNDERMLSFGTYNNVERYSLSHVVYHLTQGQLLDKAAECYLNMDNVIHLLDVASLNKDILSLLNEGDDLLKQMESCFPKVEPSSTLKTPSQHPRRKSSIFNRVLSKTSSSVLEARTRYLPSFVGNRFRRSPPKNVYVDSEPNTIEMDPSKLKYCLQVLGLAQDALSVDARMLPGQILGRVGAPPFDEDQQYLIDAARNWLDANKKRGGPKIAEPLHFGMSGLDFAGSSLEKTFTFDDRVDSVCYGNNDEICIASGNKAFVYNRQTGRKLQVFEGHSNWTSSVAISTDSKWIVTGSWDNTARIWNLNSGKPEHVLEGHSSFVTSVAISTDSKWIVTGSYDKTARIWNLNSGKQERVLEGHSDKVASVAISNDAKWIVTGSDDKTVRIWNLNSGKLEHILEGHSNWVKSVAISTDSKWIVTSDGTARIWNLNSGKQEHVLKGHSSYVCSVAISTDSKWIVTGSADNTARIWNLNSGSQEHVLKGHSRKVTSVAISTDSKWIVTGSDDKTARIWNLNSGKQEHVLVGDSHWVRSVAISTDSKWIVTGSVDKTTRVWNLRSGKQEHVLEGHTDQVWLVAISNDSKWIVTSDGTARIWNLNSGKQEHVLEGHSGPVWSAAISTDSKWIVTGGSYDHTARIWNLNSGKQEHVLEGHSKIVSSVAISTDSKWIVTGSGDGTARVWNLNSGKQEHVLEGHSSFVRSLAISTDSKWIVTGSHDKSARIWSLSSGKQKSVLERHSDEVTSVAISTDSKWIVTGSLNGETKVWSVEDGSQLSEKEAPDIFFKEDFWSSIRSAPRGSNPRHILGLQAKDVGFFVDPSAEIVEIMRKGSLVYFRYKNSFVCWKLD